MLSTGLGGLTGRADSRYRQGNVGETPTRQPAGRRRYLFDSAA